MYKIWQKKSQEEIKAIVFNALATNINFDSRHVLGIPASYLDDKVFYQDATFLKDAPFLSTLIKNPNHIGCHTVGKSESFFKGTQAIEKELIEICAVDILKGHTGGHDGYVASGGTEANIQAVWIYRNYFMRKFSASLNEICILCSSDSHYSLNKAANLCMLDIYKVPVNEATRAMNLEELQATVETAKNDGKRFFIVVCNMMTTMFGSVDDVAACVKALELSGCTYTIHVDGAYGGFYYPFSDSSTQLTFENKHITSFTLDAHKMAQAPYGTGIFLIRKNFIQYATTSEASYVEGEDCTLIGSRSGANAVAVWMILCKNGPYGWHEKILVLQKRTEWMCNQLATLGFEFYRHPQSNIITIRSRHLTKEIVHEFGLVPDDHTHPAWYKIVLMDHVTIDKLSVLVTRLKSQ